MSGRLRSVSNRDEILSDPELQKAVSRILQRSERQGNMSLVLDTFVDVGILPQLDNQNNQIFYGRRGTGKTHVLRVLSSRLGENAKNTVSYIDARTLGSTSQFSDVDVPLQQRCLALFRDILLSVYDDLLRHIIEYPSQHAEEALRLADELSLIVTEPTPQMHESSLSVSRDGKQDDSMSADVSLASVPSVKVELRHGASASRNETETSKFSYHDKIIFPSLHRKLTQVLEKADTDLYILLDEWASLPVDIQPYLAEFLKRGVLPVQKATLKIASLEHRSAFSIRSRKLGFELGADIATAPELDEYYVFDRNPEHVTEIFSDILLKHLNSNLHPKYLAKEYGIDSAAKLASRLFTEHATFGELARASEGVVRDLINIFTHAFFNAFRRKRARIDKKAVTESARQWFEQDKQTFLDDSMQRLLRRIVDEVIGKKKARSFLLPREHEKHPLIQKLFDRRVIHQVLRGYADKDNPGVRYNIYCLDYGTYVDLIGTSRQPELDFKILDNEGEEEEGIIVPFDDKRSIRRIILDERVLPDIHEVKLEGHQ